MILFQLHSEKKNISCGLIGYPNVGKSAIINTLMKRQTCKSAPLAGETKVSSSLNNTLLLVIYL